jgi:hypothetical protein
MIKAKTKSKEGKEILILGLSELNIKKLKEGQPIKIDDGRFFDGLIFITYGKTEERIAADMSSFISPNTTIINEMRGK